jgi:predicted 3-demethylubiquinone-9 3-methyltransferase (glyoxalase superfamily)
MQKIIPNLWFDREAEQAALFYVSVFSANSAAGAGGTSSVGSISYYGKEGFEVHHMPEGTALTVEFTLDGQKFLALNGGPIFKFNEAVSFIIECGTQEEIDYFWGKLSAVPESEQCGWVKDKFGLSWQIVPTVLAQLASDPDREKAGRVMTAMLKMKKLDIAALQAAYDGH